jgi:hypothetical protein
LDELTAHTAKKNRVCERLRLQSGCDELKPPTNHSTDCRQEGLVKALCKSEFPLIFKVRTAEIARIPPPETNKASGELPQRGRRARAEGGGRKTAMARNQPTNTGRMTPGDRLSPVTEPAPCSRQKFGAKIQQRNQILWLLFFQFLNIQIFR